MDSLRLVYPQPMETLPKEGWFWCLYTDGDVLYTDGPTNYYMEQFRTPVAWSYTATTAPPKTSRGYVLPEGWEGIDGLTATECECLFDEFSHTWLEFLYRGGTTSAWEEVAGRHNLLLNDAISAAEQLTTPAFLVAYRIAQPLVEVQ